MDGKGQWPGAQHSPETLPRITVHENHNIKNNGRRMETSLSIKLQCIVYSALNTELLCFSPFPSMALKWDLQALCCYPAHTTAAFCWPFILALGISAWQALQLPAYLCRSYGSAPSFDRNWEKNNINCKVHQFSHKSAWTELQNSKKEDIIREKEQTGTWYPHTISHHRWHC